MLRNARSSGRWSALDGICSDLGSVEVGATENLAPILREIARKGNFRVDQWSIPPRPNSDHLFFEKMGVPVFWLTSMDPFYHTAADVPEHVSKEKLARHTDFAAHDDHEFGGQGNVMTP